MNEITQFDNWAYLFWREYSLLVLNDEETRQIWDKKIGNEKMAWERLAKFAYRNFKNIENLQQTKPYFPEFEKDIITRLNRIDRMVYDLWETKKGLKSWIGEKPKSEENL